LKFPNGHVLDTYVGPWSVVLNCRIHSLAGGGGGDCMYCVRDNSDAISVFLSFVAILGRLLLVPSSLYSTAAIDYE
jgi:hypothetical protein